LFDCMKGVTIMKNILNTVILSAILTTGIVSAQTAKPASGAKHPTVAQRKENQQDRIAQGVKSGQLTAGETAKLETKEAAINRETAVERKANGGTLTPAERKQVRHQQNRVSKQIYKDKHNTTKQ